MPRETAKSTQLVLDALDRPETFYSLSYRLGLEETTCRDWLERLVAQDAVVRLGADEGAVYCKRA